MTPREALAWDIAGHLIARAQYTAKLPEFRWVILRKPDGTPIALYFAPRKKAA